MISISSQQTSVMTSIPHKRPRLSLLIKTPESTSTYGKSSTALRPNIDPTSPTAFNTLSNAYAAAIENASPRTARPLSESRNPTSLPLETQVIAKNEECTQILKRTQTPGACSTTFPHNPSSALPDLTPTKNSFRSRRQACAFAPDSDPAFTLASPQSAESDKATGTFYGFTASNYSGPVKSTKKPRLEVKINTTGKAPPYAHPRTLRSILRNSPLPPRSAATPVTPTRVSMRLANRASKRVGYNSPLTQTITTNKYIKSHIDLLTEKSPNAGGGSGEEKIETFDSVMTYTGDETRHGGLTPGPFEEMRQRMAESDLKTPHSRRRRHRELKRKWEWTIASSEGDGQDEPNVTKTPLTAIKDERSPATAIWRGVSVSSDSDLLEADPEDYQQVSVDPTEQSEISDTSRSRLQDTRDSIDLL